MALQPSLMETRGDYTGDDDGAARSDFRDRLRRCLQDPAFRAIEGFPIGDDDAILALSDPPYYTACPNPFLPEITKEWQVARARLRAELGLLDDSDDGESHYHREPFAADVSEGKNDPTYNAHSYHTKVPHRAIMRYILHYTDPGDIVFDGFCGTGMTGVAAQFCGDRGAVESLGYRVTDGLLVVDEGDNTIGMTGTRQAILSDLSPAATFISNNYNTPVDPIAFKSEAYKLLGRVKDECRWMYLTIHHPDSRRIDVASEALGFAGRGFEAHCADIVFGSINYTVWSDVFVCPGCSQELVFWEVAVDEKAGKVQDEFACPHCRAVLTKRQLDRKWESQLDLALGKPVSLAKQVPVRINYSVGGRRFEKVVDSFDQSLVDYIETHAVPHWYPADPLPDGFNTVQPKKSHGFTHVHHFYTKRNLWVLSSLRSEIESSAMKDQLLCLVGDQLPRASKMHKIAISRLNTNLSKTAGVLAGTLYVPSNQIEYCVTEMIAYRIEDVASYLEKRDRRTRQVCQTVSSDALTTVPSSSIDYIFTDPPFGGNIMYSELNFLWESWLRVYTNNRPEAIENPVQGKSLLDYQRLMMACFQEFHRLLKPGRWITVEFHNSKNSVWNAIQEALLRAGFIIADVRTLDKGQGTIKQVTSTETAKQDLILSAYKPAEFFEERFKLEAGTEEGAWNFVRQHLAHVPVVVEKLGVIEPVVERRPFLLFDRMVAFHIQRGATVPLSAAACYRGLTERFIERDGMVFLPGQAPEYDRARMNADRVAQLTLIVTDEKATIQWLRQQLDPALDGKPQTYQEIQPRFLQALQQARHEELPELSAMLAQNFLQDNAGRWYVPDPNKAEDLEKLRQKELLQEFARYVAGKGRLRQFRSEAVRTGFADAYRRGDYATVVKTAERLPESVLQEDPDLLMYYDNASLRVG